jgi:hypothetical protein
MKPDNVLADDVLQTALDKWQRAVKWYLLGTSAWVVPNPKARVGRGKKNRAEQWAWIISTIRGALLHEFDGSLERALDAFFSPEGRTKVLPAAAHSIADLLFEIAIRSPTAFRMLGEAFEKAERSDPHKLITAYQNCRSLAPTIDKVELKFEEMFPEEDWPGDSSARRILRSYGCLISPRKSGRPIGAEAALRRYGVPQTRNKSKKKIGTPKR